MSDIDTPSAEVEETPAATETETPEQPTADDVAALRAVVDKERSSAKAARSAADKAEARLAEMEAAELRRSVAEDKRLSPAQAAFLSGDTAEEMAESADALLAAFRSPLRRGPIEVTPRSGATGLSEPAESAAQIADKVLG